MDPESASVLKDIVAGGGLVVSGGVIAKLIDAGARAWSARNQRTRIEPQPLEVDHKIRWAEKADNALAHENIFARLSEHDKDIAALKEGSRGMKDRLQSMDGKLDILLGQGAKGERG